MNQPNQLHVELGRKIILNVLSEALDKLAILKHINGWSEDDQTVVEYQTIEEQCNTIKNDEVHPDSKDNVDLLDFRRDCSFIESTIQKTHEEIQQAGTYNGLSRLTDIFRKLQSEEAELLEDTRRKEEKYIKLQDLYYNERLALKKQVSDTMVKIGNLKDEIEDFQQQAAIKQAYVNSWQNSKQEMVSYELAKKNDILNQAIEDKQHDFTKEDRVHQEVRNIFNIMDMDLQKKLKHWKIKYEHDLEAISKKITHLQETKDDQQDKTAQMVMKYIKRQAEIDAYEAHKIELQKQRLEQERKDKAATKIQAWWRGTMVRKGFGKYKKKNKKGKKKDDKKKK